MAINMNTIDDYATDVIQGLADNPNESGLDANDLKEKFDAGADNIKKYLKTDFKDEINGAISTLENLISENTSASKLINMIYPVGSIYMSVNNVSPENFIGGTWQQITDNAYLKIVSENGGTLGGTQSHKISVNNMPSHSHDLARYVPSSTEAWSGDNSNEESGSAHTKVYAQKNTMQNLKVTLAKGSGEPYYPYFLGVYLWKRIG